MRYVMTSNDDKDSQNLADVDMIGHEWGHLQIPAVHASGDSLRRGHVETQRSNARFSQNLAREC